MTEETRKIQLATEVDATGSKQGFEQIKADARDMAQAVAQAGQAAGKGLDAIAASAGKGSDAVATSAEKLTASQSRIVESIKRASIAATEGKSGLLEYKAALAGVTDAAAPYVQKIREAESGTLGGAHAMGEFSLASAGAKRELLVLGHELSQGNFSRFGGSILVLAERTNAAGAAFSALTNPLTLAAVVLAGVAFAAVKGAKEMDGFREAVTISGNAIGISASQFTTLRDSIDGIATKGKAAEVLTEIAKNGRIAGDAVQGIAEAAILMEKATGQAVSKTIEQFAELAKSPTEAVAKLNEQYNFLTTAVFKQVKALEDQGKQVQAATLAEKTYADALKTRADDVLASAGIIEKAWRGVTGVAKGAWDAMLGIGRTLSPAEQLAAAAANVARLQAQIAAAGTFTTTEGGAAVGGGANLGPRKATLEKELSAAKQELEIAQRRAEIESTTTAAKADQNRLQQLGIAFIQQGDEFLTKQQRLQKELTKASVEGQDLVNAGIITQAELTTRLNNIRQKFLDSTGQGEVAQIRAKIDAQKELNDRLQKQIAGDIPLGTPTELTEGEKTRAKLLRELQGSLTDVARAQKVKALADAEELINEEKKGRAYALTIKGLEAGKAALEGQIDAVQKSAEAIRDQAVQQENVNANFGKSKTAMEQAKLALLQHQLAEAQESSQFSPAYVAAKDLETAAQQRFVAALQETEFKQANLKLDEAGRQASETTATLQLELSLLGTSQQEREKIIAQRRVEITLAKELADIEKLNLGQGPEADAKREELRAKARANAVVEANNAASKTVLDEWQRTADSINNSLTDALLRGFEAGKTFAQNLRDTLVNMFKTLVLRPIIQGVLAPVSGVLSTATQALTGAGGVNGLANTVNAASGLNTLAGAGSQFLFGGTAGASAASLGLANGVGAVGGDALGTLIMANGSWAGVAAGAEAAATAAGVTAGASAGAAAGGAAATGALAAIPVVGWVALAAIALYSIFGGKGGGPKQDGTAGQLFSGVGNSGHTQDGAATAALVALATQYGTLIAALGGQASGVKFGVGISADPAGTAPTFLDVSASKNNASLIDGVNLNVGRSQEELTAAIALQGSRALLAGLQASDLPQKIADFFKAQGDPLKLSADQINSAVTLATNAHTLYTEFGLLGPAFAFVQDMSVEATQALIAAGGGFEKLQGDLSSYYENFFTSEEKRQNVARQIAQTLTSAGLSASPEQVLAASRAQFRQLVEQFASMGDAGRDVYLALLSVNAAFASITDAAPDAATAVVNTQALLDGVTVAHNNLVTAYQNEANALDATVTRFRDFASSIRAFRDSLLLGELSPLTPLDKFNEAQRQFTAAQGSGDAGQLQTAAQDLLQATEAAFGRGDTFAQVFATVQDALTRSAISADASADVAQLQLTAAKGQLTLLGSIDKSAISIVDALKDLAAAVNAAVAAGLDPGTSNVAALTAAGIPVNAAPSAAPAPPATTGTTPTTAPGTAPLFDAATQAEVVAWVNAQSDPLVVYNKAKEVGISLATLDSLMSWAPMTAEDWARANNLPVFHQGTSFVPQTGLALMQQGERVFSAADNQAVMASLQNRGNSEAVLVAEIKALREQVSILTSRIQAGDELNARATSDAAREIAGGMRDGLSQQARVSQLKPEVK